MNELSLLFGPALDMRNWGWMDFSLHNRLPQILAKTGNLDIPNDASASKDLKVAIAMSILLCGTKACEHISFR